MSSVIQNLLENTIGDGARSAKFDCIIQFGESKLLPSGKEISAQVKTSQFPGKIHEVIDFKFKGRTIPIKGQTKYDNTWSCTFYLTQDHALKKAFEDWIESIDQVHNIKEVSTEVKNQQYLNVKDNSANTYTTTLAIQQLNFDADQDTATYYLYHAFPKNVTAVDVDYSAVGTILEYTVEFSYAYYDTYNIKAKSGLFVDELKKEIMGGINSFTDDIKKGIASSVPKKFKDISLTDKGKPTDVIKGFFK